MAKRRANPIDDHVAKRLRKRREELSWSQTKLGDVLGVSFQQVQKYERGANRISAGNLWKLAKALTKPVGYFYEGLA